ncbi:MAG: TonB family protein [Chitinophagaceae bacterium]
MAVLLFIAKLILSCALLYGYYHFFLRNKRFHHYNRFYLLAIALLSLIIPFLNIPVNLFGFGQQHPTLIQTLRVINANGWEEPVTIYARQNQWSKWISMQNALYIIYIAGAVTSLIMLLRSLAWIQNLKRKYPYEIIDQLKIYNTTEPGTPFSFFRSIFWDRKISLDDKKGRQIFRHEMFHVKEKHSADILLMETLSCICWFNPFYHLIKKEIKAIHEFLADEYAISENNRYDYAELLVSYAITQKSPVLTNPFFHNQIKRRITMITQSNLIRRSGYISRIMALPLLFLLVSAFAVKLTHKPFAHPASHYAIKNTTVVIDPGHGGIFPGAVSKNGIYEKDINLSIAQKIKELAPQYNVNVVLTRNSDATVGNATELREDLLNRVAITNNEKPDLLLSLHVNTAMEKTLGQTGFEAYISRRKADIKAKQLATVILGELKNIYATSETIQLRDEGITVIDKSDYPSVLIECGFLNNPQDEIFITNKDNQEKTARKILEGIVKYSNAQGGDGIIQKDTLAKVTYTRENKTSADTMTYFTHSIDNKDTTPAIIFTKVEIEPDYAGGEKGWIAYLIKNVHYPKDAIAKKLQGTVVVEFIVDTNGKISDVKAISGPKELQAESIRVVKESGNWISAVQNGKKVKAYKRQPITFKLA